MIHYINIIYTKDLLLDNFTVFDKIILNKNKDTKPIFHVLNLYTENTIS